MQIVNILNYKGSNISSHLVSESSQRAVPPAGLQPEDLEGRGDDHLLLLVIRRGDSLECLQALQGVLSSLGLVRSHATDSPPEDLGRSSAKLIHTIRTQDMLKEAFT